MLRALVAGLVRFFCSAVQVELIVVNSKKRSERAMPELPLSGVWKALLLSFVICAAGCGPEVQDPPPPAAKYHLELALQHLEGEDFEEAVREVELAENIAPLSYQVKMGVGRVYAKRGFLDRAMVKFARAEELNDKTGRARLEIGRL